MRLGVVVFLVVLIVFVSLDVSNAARGRSGGSRSGGSRTRSGSSSKSNSGSKSGSASKVTKYTPIKATTVRSPVIVSQARTGSRSNTFKKVMVAYVVYRYTLSTAPVYRGGYSMHRSYVTIPDERAVRINYEEEKLLDSEGNLCLGQSSVTQTLREGIEEDLAELNTTVKYNKTGETQTYYGNTISLEDIKEQDFEVTSRARYNTTIVQGTNCTQVEKNVQGTMVAMYETNPDTASSLYINKKLLIALFVIIHLYVETLGI